MPALINAPNAAWETVTQDGVAPENFHSTSMFPEYFKLDGKWRLAEESRMDACVVVGDDGPLPEVIGDAYQAAAEMRKLVKNATTVICMATPTKALEKMYGRPLGARFFCNLI